MPGFGAAVPTSVATCSMLHSRSVTPAAITGVTLGIQPLASRGERHRAIGFRRMTRDLAWEGELARPSGQTGTEDTLVLAADGASEEQHRQ